MEKISIYFHWPYCKSKCPYCDFFKKVKKNVDQNEVISSYIKELEYYHNLIPKRCVKSVFFGGGTPSLMEPKQIEKLLNVITKHFRVDDDVEISLEANPNTNSPSMFEDFKMAGINRLSLGVQALNEKDLKFLGRTHTLNEAYQSIEDVLKMFDNHSIDLIYARPEQKLKDWLNELEMAVSFGLKHLSCYQLSIEEGTVFALKGIKPLDENKAADMYLKTVEFLRAHNYPRYEVSNFAIPMYESVHNKCYWEGGDYIGIGESAHGRLKINGKFYATIHPHQTEELSQTQRAEELIIMGLRLQKGIDKARFKEISGIEFDQFISKDQLKNLVQKGFLIDTPHFLSATDKGFLVLDKLIEDLC